MLALVLAFALAGPQARSPQSQEGTVVTTLEVAGTVRRAGERQPVA